MVMTVEGRLAGEGLKVSIVVSRFNDFITSRLLDGALDALVRHGTPEENISVVRVPGAFEIPFMAKRLALSGKYHAVICLGAVIRGQTPHFEYVAAETSKGIAQVAMETGVPVIYGVVTADTLEQAIERAGSKAGNRGWDAAVSALEMVDVVRQLAL